VFWKLGVPTGAERPGAGYSPGPGWGNISYGERFLEDFWNDVVRIIEDF
jgi:hypothetical protein